MVGERTQSLKCLPCTYEDLSVISHNPHTNARCGVMCTEEGETDRSLGLDSQLVYPIREYTRPCLKGVGQCLSMIPKVVLWTPCACAYMCMHTRAHACTPQICTYMCFVTFSHLIRVLVGVRCVFLMVAGGR